MQTIMDTNVKKAPILDFSPKWFERKNNSSQWSKSLQNIPEKFCLESIRKHLVDSADKTFDKDSVRAFKSLKAYKYFQEGYVQKIYTSDVKDCDIRNESMFLAKSEVMASMERKTYKTFVCVDSNGDVLGGCCKCVAGKGSVCSHMAALLFALEDFVAQGFLNTPDDLTCTDKLKQWNIPAKRTVEHTTIDKIRIFRPQLGKAPRATATATDNRHVPDRTVNENSLKTLHSEISSQIPDCGFSKYALPDCSGNAYSKERNVKADFIQCHPASVSQIEEASKAFTESLSVNVENIEKETVEQSKSKKWHLERQKRITASNFHTVLVKRESTDPSRIIKQVLGYTSVSTRSMKFGLEMENYASRRYLDYIDAACNGLELKYTGLKVSDKKPFLGASVDGLLVDSQGNIVKLVEFKNPASTWNMSLKEAAMKLPCLKLDENNQATLNTKDKYFTQVQGQMGVYQVTTCDFVLCTASDILVETVTFDLQFWQKLSDKLENFYQKYIAPEIVYPLVKYGYPALHLQIK